MPEDDIPISVVVAADSSLVSDGLCALLSDVPHIDIVGSARNDIDLLDLVGRFHPDAVIISIRTAAATTATTTLATMDTARRLRLEFPLLSIVVIADRGNGFAFELLRSGASRIAYLIDEPLLSVDTLLGALHEIRAGQTVLDPSIVNLLVHPRRADTAQAVSGADGSVPD